MRRLNLATAVVGGGVVGGVGWVIAHQILPRPMIPISSNQVDARSPWRCWAIGFMAGIGAFNGPIRWLIGRDLTHDDEMFLAGKDQGVGRVTSGSPRTTRWSGSSTWS